MNTPGQAHLADLLAEAGRFGGRFKICGAQVRVENAWQLPDWLLAELGDRRDDLWKFLGGAAQDQPSLDLLAQLGVEVVVPQTEAEALDLIEEMELDADRFGGDNQVGFDIETTALPGMEDRPILELTRNGVPKARQPSIKGGAGLDPRRSAIRLVQLYGGGKRCMVLDAHVVPLRVFTPVLSRCVAVIHNASFEAKFLHAAGIPLPRFECTLQAAGLLLGVHRRGLDDAASAYLGLDLPKGLQTSDWGAPVPSRGQLAYAAIDAIVALRLWRQMQPELHVKGREKAYYLQRDLIPASTHMAAHGVLLDHAEHARQVQTWSVELANARQAFLAATGEAPPGTPRAIVGLLNKVLGPEVLAQWPRTGKTGELATGEKHLRRAAPYAPAIRHLIDIKQREKLLSSFGNTLARKASLVTGRLHAQFNIAAAKTGRASSREPNMQQIPASKAAAFRNCFVAAPNHILVMGDYNAMELRAAAEISNDAAMRNDFANGVDLHRVQAAAMNNISECNVTPAQRQAAKAINFGTIYGSGGAGLAMSAWASYGVEMSVEEAAEARDKFFARYAQLHAWMRSNADRCQRRGYIEIGRFGRVIEAAWERPEQSFRNGGCTLDDDDDENNGSDDDALNWTIRCVGRQQSSLRYTLCCNAPVQGACADVMMLAMTAIDKALSDARIDGGLILSVHDELVLEVPDERADEAAALLAQCMEQTFLEVFPVAPTRGLVEIKRGHSWGAAKAGLRATAPALTEKEAARQAKLAARAEREREMAERAAKASAQLAKNHKLYGVILADPPSRFEPRSRITGMSRAADNHYQTLTTDAIAAIRVPSAPDCVLFLWATVAMKCHALHVMKSWGFEYKSTYHWHKPGHGTGYWSASEQMEELLVGTRGRVAAPAPGTQPPQMQSFPRGRHSEKPATFAAMIEKMYPTVPKLEMFARTHRLGWDVWGDEAPTDRQQPDDRTPPIAFFGVSLCRSSWEHQPI
jgi:DNA polymerase I-like protein with 3'-5' exonuclease and polymerase domains/N6-adenosine-specific RNA methylase IME4